MNMSEVYIRTLMEQGKREKIEPEVAMRFVV